MSRFNLSEWALAHRNFVVYLMGLMLVLGVMGYRQLGQSEDPPFTFKVMQMQVNWPGATAQEMESQIADPIERTLMESPHVDIVRSFSRPGETQFLVAAKDDTRSDKMPDMFYQIRKRVGDMAHNLPEGVQGPYFNDEFGETYGNIFALVGRGYTLAQMKDVADDLRKELLRVPNVAKVDIIGEQPEKIYIEISSAKLANLGVSLPDILGALQAQNEQIRTGIFETPTDRIALRLSGVFRSIDDIRNLAIRSGTRVVLLKDIANVHRAYADPPAPVFRFMGSQALGIGVSMRQGGDIIALGRDLDKALSALETRLPAGLKLDRLNDQPNAVRQSVGEFQKSVLEAGIVVLAVSFFSLGMRAGAVVALSIPLVLAATFYFMSLFDVGLHKISLGSLILGLGLLVDDAIIAVEMMAVKMEQGMERAKAAAFAYTSTAFPMLTGTLITAAGFLPIATAHSSVGEYTRSIFQVVGISLLLSWLAAVIIIPYLGFRLLPEGGHEKHDGPKASGGMFGAVLAWQHRAAVWFYRVFRTLIVWCLVNRLKVIAITLALFALSVYGFRFVQEQFFPDATRLELMVDLRLPEGSSQAATEAEVERVERYLQGQMQHMVNYAAYVGNGSSRFYLPLDQQLPASNFAQFVITTKSIADREALRAKLARLMDGPEFANIRGRVLRLENGPPVGFPVQFRVVGNNVATLRHIGDQVAAEMQRDPDLRNVQFDWFERSKDLVLEVDQQKARALGINRNQLAQVLQGGLSGVTVGQYREDNRLISIVLRGTDRERQHISAIESLSVPTASGATVPLSQIARIVPDQEEGYLWRRNREPTLTVRGDIYGNTQAPVISERLDKKLDAIRSQLPPGYRIDMGGAIEESAKANGSIAQGMPLFFLSVLTLLMIQLQSFQRVILVVLTAPLGIIGVTLSLLLLNQPFGFVAMLGTIALSGMIMRNSVILIDQIERNRREGMPAAKAIIEAAVLRFRPIMLTAMTAILAMIPLSYSVFFGPMAVAIMGGLFIATLLTLLFLPALYGMWFRVPVEGETQ